MISALRQAYGGGFRAGKAAPRIQGLANTRGIKSIVSPLNPYANTFAPRWRLLLALVWEIGKWDGLMKRLNRKA